MLNHESCSYRVSQTPGVLVWTLSLHTWLLCFPGQVLVPKHFSSFCLTHDLCISPCTTLLQAEILGNMVHKHRNSKNAKLNWLYTEINRHSKKPLGSNTPCWLMFLSCHLKISRSIVIKDKFSPWAYTDDLAESVLTAEILCTTIFKEFITSIKSTSGMLCYKKAL